MVGVGGVEVESSVLGLQERQKASTNEKFSVNRGSQVVRRVTTARNVGNVDELAKSVLVSPR